MSVRFWLLGVVFTAFLIGGPLGMSTTSATDDAVAADGGDPATRCLQAGYPAWDAFPSLGVAIVDIDLDTVLPVPVPPLPNGFGGPFPVELDGSTSDTVVCRSQPLPPGCTEDCVIETEILQLGLQGHDPILGDIQVDVNPFQPSLGRIEGASVDPLGGNVRW